MIRQYCNCSILRDGKIIKEDLWTQDDKIIDPQKRFWEAVDDAEYAADVIIDCKNMLLAPGFIDLQINGAFGVDFSSSEVLVDELISDDVTVEERLLYVAKKLVSHGVTSFCPTIITSKPSTYRKILPFLKQRNGSSKTGANILGAHVEGPFISEIKYGAHPSKLIQSSHESKNNDDKLLDIYGSLENISIVTLAPELDGALDSIKHLSNRNIVVSLGHSNCNLSQAEKAASCGAKMITHLFNAMSSFHHRDPGLIGLLANDNIYYGIICDGIHAAPASVKIAYKANPHGVCLVTDAIQAMGLKPGQYKIGEQDIQVNEDRAVVANTSTLAGAICCMCDCVKNFKKFTNCSIPEALEAASLHPAKAMGIDHKKGRLKFGLDADIILLDDELNLQGCWIAGDLAYKANKCLWKDYTTANDKNQYLAVNYLEPDNKLDFMVPSVVLQRPVTPKVSAVLPKHYDPYNFYKL